MKTRTALIILVAVAKHFDPSTSLQHQRWPRLPRSVGAFTAGEESPLSRGSVLYVGLAPGTAAPEITQQGPEQDLQQVAQEIFPRGTEAESRSNNFYGALSFAAAAVGQGHLSLLFQGIAGAETSIRKLDTAYNALPEEVERFATTLESVRVTLDCTLEECSIDSVFSEEQNVPPQVVELTQLIAEGEDFIRGLGKERDFVSVVANQLLLGNECPCSKLSQLSVKIKEAESKLQLYKAVQLVRRQNEEEAADVRRQMKELQTSIQEMRDTQQTMSREETVQAQRTHQLLRDSDPDRCVYSERKRNTRLLPIKLFRRIFRQKKLKPTTLQFEKLKEDPTILNSLFDDRIGDDTSEFLTQLEESSYPLRVETPVPADEAKRLRVLHDLRLVQLEMEGNPVGKGFEYHRNELIRTIVKLLKDTVPECAPFALQVVGDQDSYTLNGEHARAPVTPRSQVPCQHVVCLSKSDKAKLSGGAIDGYTSADVLAINLRGKHSALTDNFCYTADTLAYVGAAIRINDVTIGSMCMASTKTLQDLRWNHRKSAFVRKVANVLEEQLTRLCVDWTLYEGELPSDWGLLDLDKLLADAHFENMP